MKERSIQGLIIEAHPDDAALASGGIRFMQRRGANFDLLTLTDGGARQLPGVSAEALVSMRYAESRKAGSILNMRNIYHAGLPDGALTEEIDKGLEVVSGIVAVTKPDFIIVTNTADMHPDHAAAGLIAREVAGNEIPVYEMDTQTRRDHNGDALKTTHILPVSRRDVSQRNNGYLAHRSQTTGLPPEQMRDVFEVLALPNRRGKEYGLPRAAVLFLANPSAGDPIAEVMGDPWLQSRRKAA